MCYPQNVQPCKCQKCGARWINFGPIHACGDRNGEVDCPRFQRWYAERRAAIEADFERPAYCDVHKLYDYDLKAALKKEREDEEAERQRNLDMEKIRKRREEMNKHVVPDYNNGSYASAGNYASGNYASGNYASAGNCASAGNYASGNYTGTSDYGASYTDTSIYDENMYNGTDYYDGSTYYSGN